ncbi:MAG TPA: PhzF family phenazine biosynthesis protein [Pyrinomonadaceae bacterium]|nr:PhzF family phenazine biosynthesis protein [Pyrinomonadaceae bacterium]
MAIYRFVQLDVFTDEPFAGNALAVFPEAEGLTDEQMMKIAREMNLSETVFVLSPGEQAANSKQQSANDETTRDAQAAEPTPTKEQPAVLRRLRIFTPTRELPFAGHPIVGTWNALAHEGVVTPPESGSGWVRIHHEVGIGILPVDIEFKDGAPLQVVMTQGKFEILNEIDDSHEQAELARALGRAREDLDESLPLQVITTGLSCLAVPIRSLSDLSHCRVNSTLLAEIYTRLGAAGCLAFSCETIEIGDARAHARFFAPADNIPEDPATGSACGALGGYLVYHGASGTKPVDGKHDFVIEQGDFISRPSRIHLEVKGTAGSIDQIRVGGQSVIVARGEVFF